MNEENNDQSWTMISIDEDGHSRQNQLLETLADELFLRFVVHHEADEILNRNMLRAKGACFQRKKKMR
jgi:hypothetical protein